MSYSKMCVSACGYVHTDVCKHVHVGTCVRARKYMHVHICACIEL